MKQKLSLIIALAVLLLVSGGIGLVGGRTAQVATPVQPALAEMAAETPDELVRVMFGVGADRTELAGQVESLGGRVVKDLHIINALAAEMPAGAAAELAQFSSVTWMSLDGPVISTGNGNGNGNNNGGGSGSGSTPLNYFLDTLNVEAVWDMGYQGEGIAVAVIDSGIQRDKDLQVDPTKAKPDSRVVVHIEFSDSPGQTADMTGHGTHVAGIIGGSGWESGYLYAGIAPKVNLISLGVSDSNGMALESDTVDALQWVLENKDTYNIRVVNLSIQSTVEQSYHQSALNAAAEILWFNGVVVVVSSGNAGVQSGINPVLAAPANDPFFITVGASMENFSGDRTNDAIAPFTARGVTPDGFTKPEIMAPGKDIISILAASSTWENENPERVVDSEYFRISGTSMAAPMVSGAAALLLQAEPNLTPDQVKYRLMQTGSQIIDKDDGQDYNYLDVYAALTTSTSQSANTGTLASQLLWSGSEPVNWNSVNWNSVNWNSVNWNAVNWNAVNWNAVNWNAVDWNN